MFEGFLVVLICELFTHAAIIVCVFFFVAATWEICSMGRNTNYARNILLNDSDFDDDFEINALLALEAERLERERVSTSHYGFVPGRRFIQRDYGQGHQRLFQDYFAHLLVYPLIVFRRRFE
ncbi:hypothetical protein ACB092_10G125400 [Castanea dentata]